MYCTNCGAGIGNDFAFCPICGNQIGSSIPININNNSDEHFYKQKNEKENMPLNSIAEERPALQDSSNGFNFENASDVPVVRKKKIRIIIVALSLVFILGVSLSVVLMMLQRSAAENKKIDSGDRTKNTELKSVSDTADKLGESVTLLEKDYEYNPYNSLNESKVIRHRNWIFYINDRGNITRVNLDGTGYQNITAELNCYQLSADGDYIYFVSADDYLVYRVKYDGSSIEKVIDYPVAWKAISNGLLYYIEGSYFFDETSHEFYTNDDFFLYSVDLKTMEKNQINQCRTDSVNIIDGSIYYYNTDDNCIYKTDLTGSEDKVRILGVN